ncbi:MAG: glycosyltransferase family 4 protein [Planctomycetes bacterium]|nr:glycosyltransferase family 4 protein [Planctomycetota bacterium]
MKILMFGWEFPPYISGGLGIVCYELTKALVNKGHEITLVLPAIKGKVDPNLHVTLVSGSQMTIDALPEPVRSEIKKEVMRQLEIKRIDSPLRPYITQKEYSELPIKIADLESEYLTKTQDLHRSFELVFSGDYGPDLISEVTRYSILASIFAKIPHDVIHIHDWLTVMAGIKAKQISGRPLVYHVHSLEFDRSGENMNREIYNIEKLGMELADKIIPVSYYTKELIIKYYGIHPDKIEAVHNAVKKEEVAPSCESSVSELKRDKIVLFLGRITFQKGPDYFVEAAAKVLQKRKNVRFVMAGSGDMAPRMIERVAQLKIGRYFHFTGFLRGSDVEKIYAQSDVYVMPSVSEPFGISPLEAMRYNVPVIISNQSGVAEILKHALTVDFWDIDDIANKIIALLDHNALRNEMVTRASEELKNFQWDKAAEKVADIYNEITKHND